ncbi:baculoviral IAP repeat-containing protein 5-like [Ornithodoros turicata]
MDVSAADLTLEKVLTECSDACMYLEKNRLASFTSWPFAEGSKCTKENMARAGFYLCPTASETDLTRCYVCFREMMGWEPDDDPIKEHARSTNCLLLQLEKTEDQLTLRDVLNLEQARSKNRISKLSSFMETQAANKWETVKKDINTIKREARSAKKV